jgi:hypothetical protein
VRVRVDWLPGLRALATSVSDSLCQGSGTGFSPPVRSPRQSHCTFARVPPVRVARRALWCSRLDPRNTIPKLDGV